MAIQSAGYLPSPSTENTRNKRHHQTEVKSSSLSLSYLYLTGFVMKELDELDVKAVIDQDIVARRQRIQVDSFTLDCARVF